MANQYQKFLSPTKTTAPVADTSAGLYTFVTPVTRAIVHNTTGQILYLRLNTTTAASAAMGGYDLAVASAATVTINPADHGLREIKYVGVWCPAAATVENINIRGT